MTRLDLVPLWAAVPVAILLVIGATLALLGAVGLLRLRTFYDRLHAPTLCTSWGTAATILASMVMFTTMSGRPVIHEIVIGIFVMITTPITLLMLGRAALRRDRAKDPTMLDEGARLPLIERDDGTKEAAKTLEGDENAPQEAPPQPMGN
ncbi:MAG: monovalent cation/H(+) antiporter subunit G [Paracoccus sp. (in: a-proteobacteria)]|nr:monovalent cation/H(+) antiporter subunit G [Paracoccus sp. (in: a-proteobacteria)]